MNKPNLRLADTEEPTRVEIAMAEIEQAQREYRGDNGHPWTPYSGPTDPWSHKVTAAISSQYRIVVSGRVPWWRRWLRVLCATIHKWRV